ncbi:hypothetical protein OG753_38980 [Streptomyces sp. NBC_00029]|uniref:effector-associated constant component EACC1 n=1 Tax=Streptomyces sp. NBC_00029 TaxID=2903613 RepID=UPI00324F6548
MAGMRVRIESGDGGPGAADVAGPTERTRLTGDFADWLAQDRDVSRHAGVHRVRAAAPGGAMSGGDVVEWISLAVSSGFSATALVYAHRTFRASLPPRLRAGSRLVVEYDGVRVVVEDGTPQDAARIARALAAGRPAPDVAGTPDAEDAADAPDVSGRTPEGTSEDAHGAGS